MADHLRKRRLDLRLTKIEAGRRLGIGPWTYTRWESGEMAIQTHYYPRIIALLGYNPLPKPTSIGRAVHRARVSRGLSRAALARLIGIQYEGTIQRIEEDRAVNAKSLSKVCIALGLNETRNPEPAVFD